jgi:enamine deaminase RidA (YjgF/YER057c/UK114 family)
VPIESINPSGLLEPQGYAHVAVASGSRTVYVAGQTGQHADGTVAGPDLASQTAQALTNVATALEAAGATFADVVKTTIYVAGWTPERMGELFEGTARVAERLGLQPDRPVTLVGVEALAGPELLVEFDVTAVVG